MSRQPTISVALATYNGARFLGEQLESLARQTLQPLELVVCDDGSTDDTLEILERWCRAAPFPVHIHQNPTRLGFADNFLRAASLCQGDLIAFCDQDDVWLPDKLTQCAARFQADPELRLATYNAWVTDESLAKKRLLQPRSTAIYHQSQLRLFDHRFFGFSMVFDGRILRDFPFTDRPTDYILEGPMPHDHWVPFLASALGKILIDGEPTALYRQHGKNAMGAEWKGDTPDYAVHCKCGTVREQLIGLQARLSEWGEFLFELSSHASTETERDRLRSAGERYTEISRRYGFRAAIYGTDAGIAARLRSLAELAKAGGYRPHRSGGLGARPLLRDLAAAALGAS